ncbi:hypothetical protein Tco_0450474 [Tanacetum coccineum]
MDNPYMAKSLALAHICSMGRSQFVSNQGLELQLCISFMFGKLRMQSSEKMNGLSIILKEAWGNWCVTIQDAARIECPPQDHSRMDLYAGQSEASARPRKEVGFFEKQKITIPNGVWVREKCQTIG